MAKETRITSEVLGSVLRFAFPTGQVDADGKPTFQRYEVDVAALPVNIQQYGVIHGIKQKLVDSMAMGMETRDGKVYRPTIADKFAALRETANRLARGEWNEVREGPVGGLLYNAMAALYPDRWADAADFREWLDGQASKRGVKVSAVESALRLQRKVADKIEELRAQMGKASAVNGDDLLDELAD